MVLDNVTAVFITVNDDRTFEFLRQRGFDIQLFAPAFQSVKVFGNEFIRPTRASRVPTPAATTVVVFVGIYVAA